MHDRTNYSYHIGADAKRYITQSKAVYFRLVASRPSTRTTGAGSGR